MSLISEMSILYLSIKEIICSISCGNNLLDIFLLHFFYFPVELFQFFAEPLSFFYLPVKLLQIAAEPFHFNFPNDVGDTIKMIDGYNRTNEQYTRNEGSTSVADRCLDDEADNAAANKTF